MRDDTFGLVIHFPSLKNILITKYKKLSYH